MLTLSEALAECYKVDTSARQVLFILGNKWKNKFQNAEDMDPLFDTL